MGELHWTELANLVVAWHNRHPLARRVGIQHVHSLGYVLLPFVDADGVHTRAAPGGEPLPPEAMTGSLRERAMARAQLMAQGAAAQPDDAPATPASPAHIRPAFDEDFLPPHSTKAVQRWAQRHAVVQTTPRGDVPVRKVRTQAGVAGSEVLARWVLTAQVEVGHARTRVLVGAGERPAVLGRRLLGPFRLLAVLALAGALAAAAWWALQRQAGGAAQAAPSAAARPAPAASPPTPAASVTAAAAAATAASAGVTAAERPVDVEPRLGQVDLPSISPRVDERRRKARDAAASAATPAAAATHSPPAAAAPGNSLKFAVATRLLRTRSESEQVAAAMRELLTKQAGSVVKVEVLPVGDDWRVVGWPYADKALADQARALLASRGMKVEVIDF